MFLRNFIVGLSVPLVLAACGGGGGEAGGGAEIGMIDGDSVSSIELSGIDLGGAPRAKPATTMGALEVL